MATAASMPDMKVSDPSSLASMTGDNNSVSQSARTNAANKASRSNTGQSAQTSQAPLDVWMLPMTAKYTLSSRYDDFSSVSKGIDLVVPEGTPFYASYSGKVTLARWNASYGYAVTLNVGNGVELVYGHASKLLVHEGQLVKSGDLLGLSGNTGYSMGPNVHLEVRLDGQTIDALAFLKDNGVDLKAHTDMSGIPYDQAS